MAPSTRGDAGPGLESETGLTAGLGIGLEICTVSGFGAADGLDFNCLDAGLWDALATTLLAGALDFFATALRVFATGVLTGAFAPPRTAFVAAAFRAGASGYLLKNSAASELLQAIQEVFQGRSYVTPLATRGMVDNLLQETKPAKKTGALSSRQREVLQLLAEGHTMKQIARILRITPRTVAFHKYRMMAELGIKSSAELVQYAIKQRVVSV